MKQMSNHQTHNTSANVLTVRQYRDIEIEEHFHKNYEIVYVLEGSATVRVEDNVFEMKAGDALAVNSYQSHSMAVDGEGLLWVITFSPICVKSFCLMMEGLDTEAKPFPLSSGTEALIRQRMIGTDSRLHGHFQEIPQGEELSVKACLYALCDDWMKHMEVRRVNGEKTAITCAVMQYIAENFKKDISLSSAARELSYSYHYLSKVFNYGMENSFKAMLNRTRAEYALQLLEESDAPVTEISHESGFQSQRTFNRVFIECFKISPTQYRKRFREQRKAAELFEQTVNI